MSVDLVAEAFAESVENSADPLELLWTEVGVDQRLELSLEVGAILWRSVVEAAVAVLVVEGMRGLDNVWLDDPLTLAMTADVMP